ncbi:MAG: trimethylamine methyltransferase family protein [Thermoplasmata archaeon]|nr:trimethylamine methyltransferase family protein [Thermoplasmata archaeon]
MAKSVLKFLNREEEDLIHAQSLKILEELGVLIHSKSVLRLLKDNGAIVDENKMITKLPENMVIDALKKTPKEFCLYGRDPKNDVMLPAKEFPYISTNGLSVYMTDLETGDKRKTTRRDLAMFAKLADSLDEVGFFWPQVTATDVPDMAHNVHELWTSFQNTTKHIQGDSVNADDARMQVKLGSLIAGGEDELRKRPIFSVTCCPIAPLMFEKGAIEGQVEFAKAGVPVSSMSMSLSGLSSPVTVAGTIVNANAENLASITITQTANPGAPHLYASESTPINMTTGMINYKANESPMIASALAQMALRYKMPCLVGQWGVDGDKPGILISFNELATIAMTMLSGTDCCSGMGGLESAKGGSLEQMVIDSYLWDNFKPILRNMVVDRDMMAFDVMREVGQGNSYLKHPHTAKYFRKELFFPDKKKMAWEKTQSSDMVAEAKAIVKSKLKEHYVEPLDGNVIKQGDEMIKEFEKSL